MNSQILDVETRRQNILVALELGMIDADAAEEMLLKLIEDAATDTHHEQHSVHSGNWRGQGPMSSASG
jgi:hypothetical protein